MRMTVRCLYLRSSVSTQRTAFLTRNLLGLTEDGCALCPNFVALYAYELTHNRPLGKAGTISVSRVWKDYACVAASEVFDSGNGARLLLAELPGSTAPKREVSPFASEEMAFSFIAQSMIALTTFFSLGLVHNDCAHRNFVAQRVPTSVLAYQFPFAVVASTGVPSVLALRTSGIMWALTDFGCSTQKQFALKGDPRFPEGFDGTDSHRWLREYYYPDLATHVPKNASLLTCKTDMSEMMHPLETNLTDFERDVAYFLTETITRTEQDATRARINAYARAALAQFAAVPLAEQTATQHMHVTARVLSPQFVRKFFGHVQTSRFFAEHTVTAEQHIYRLPGLTEADALSNALANFLNSDVQMHALVRVNG